MVGSRSVGATVLWLSLLFLMAAVVTAAVFTVFVAGPDRGMTFYVCLGLVVAAEMVFFSHLLHSRLAQAQAGSATSATRIQVQGLIFVWFVLTVIAAAVAASPSRADALAADRVLVIDFILTFLFFGVAYALYARDREVEAANVELHERRRQIQANAEPVREVLEIVSQLGRRHAAHAVLADQVHKKVDMVRAQLEAALVSERTAQQVASEQASQVAPQVARLVELAGRAKSVSEEEAPGALQEIAAQCETLLGLLRRRERAVEA